MPQQTRPDDRQDMPDQAATKKPADDSSNSSGTWGDEGGGITNRPLEQEQDSQARVPPRGERKDARDSVTHDRQSPVVNDANDDARRPAADRDQAMPVADATLPTKI